MHMDVVLRSEALRRGNGQHKIACPFCGPERKKKNDRTLSLSVTQEKVLYQCWHCQEHGVVTFDDGAEKFQRRERAKVVAKKLNTDDLSADSIAFLKSRSISRDTAEAAGLRSARSFVRAANSDVDVVVFPYKNGGKSYAEKLRWSGGKGFSCNGAPATFWNIDNVQTNDDMIICEGEMDALSFIECGYESAVSIPNGAPMKLVDGQIDPRDDEKFRYVWEAKDKMEFVGRVIICTDSDGPGQVAAEELARRIGKDVCWRIKMPEGFKDANDVLMAQGRDGIDALVKSAEPWPISGLYDSSHYFDQVDKIFDEGLGSGATTGYASVDEYYTVAPGMLTVVTGHPSMGKSEFVDQIMVNLAKGRGWKFAICSFENEPRLHITKIISKYLEKRFTIRGGTISDAEMDDAKQFVQSHFSFVHQSDGDLSTVSSIIERLKVAVKRHGIRGAVIDPYNYIVKEGDTSETEWISTMLSRIRTFAQAYGLHIWFVAHPTKMMRTADGKVPPPMGYDISGCHDSETEVLTSSGWVSHPQLSEEHMVAAYDPASGSISYEKPSVIHVYDHDGPMHHWFGDSMDMLVTPNHRMVAKRNPSGSYSFNTSSEVTSGRWYFPASSSGVSGGDDSALDGIDLGYDRDDLMWFIGFWVAEGCVQSNSLSVCQAEDQHDVPKAVMDRLGLSYADKISDGRYREKRMWVSRLYRKWHVDLIDFVIRECGSGAINKRVPPMIWGMTREAKMAFLEGYWFGDGADRNNSRQAYTISEGLADDIQRLAVECGLFTSARKDYSKNERWADRYAVTWREQDHRSVQGDRNLTTVNYTGKVYCVTVSTGAYVTRRNGKVAYHGNSAAWFAKADHGLTVHRPSPDLLPTTNIISWKSRFSWLGKQGSCSLSYDKNKCIYTDDSFDPFEGLTSYDPTDPDLF
jgi:twinkle protein